MSRSNSLHADTQVTQVGGKTEPFLGSVNPPLFRASTVLFKDLEHLREVEERPFEKMHYGRLGNPTTWAIEDAVAELEGGYKAVAANSGLSIIATVLFAFAQPNAHFLVPGNVYPGVRRFCLEVLRPLGIEIEFYDREEISHFEQKLRPQTALVYVESPGSSDFALIDLPAVIARCGARGIPVIVDNTWATPLFQKPLQLGADISLHSASKYIVGHSDALLGLAVCTQEMWRRIKHMAFYLGAQCSPDDAYLALRGLRTLPLRMARHQSSALILAEWLESRPEVETVLFPALPSSPDHALWKRDFKGASGRFAVKLKRCTPAAVSAFFRELQHFGIGFGWGGFESLVVPDDAQQPRGLRFSIGLEDPGDLIDDLEEAFKRLNKETL